MPDGDPLFVDQVNVRERKGQMIIPLKAGIRKFWHNLWDIPDCPMRLELRRREDGNLYIILTEVKKVEDFI